MFTIPPRKVCTNAMQKDISARDRGSGFMITGPARYKPNIWWATLTGHFSNNIKVIIAQMGAAAEMFAAQLYRERRR